jgi:hypothetical protein
MQFNEIQVYFNNPKRPREAASNETHQKDADKYAAKPTDLDAVFDLQHLTTTIHPCFEVHLVRTVQFTCSLIFDIGICFDRVMGAAHTPLGWGGFSLWNSHR